MGESKLRSGIDNHSKTDWTDYRESPDHYINSISTSISREQFAKLQAYPALAATGKIAGFRSIEPPRSNGVLGLDGIQGKQSDKNNDTAYNLLTNSCIDYAGQGLAHIGLAGKNFDGNGLLMPHRQIKDFLDEMAKHNQGGISVRYEGKTHVLQPGQNVDRFWDEVAPDWDYVPYYMQNGNPDIRETQYAETRAPSADTAVLNLSSMPKPFQNLYPKIQAHLNTYHEKNGIPIDEEKLNNASLALAALGYSKRMNDAPLFNVKDGQYLIGDLNISELAIIAPNCTNYGIQYCI